MKPKTQFIDLKLTSKDDFKSFYLSHSITEICANYNIDIFELETYIKDYELPIKAQQPVLLNKLALIDYYVTQNHTRIETIKYFNTTRAVLQNNLTLYKIIKDDNVYLDEFLSNLDKDKFIEFYKTHTLVECRKEFNIKNNCFLYKILHAFGIRKSVPLSDLIDRISKKELEYYLKNFNRKVTLEHFKITEAELVDLKQFYKIANRYLPATELVNLISREELFNYYVLEDHSFKETIQYFKKRYNLNGLPLTALLRLYQINKLNYSKQLILDFIATHDASKYTLHQVCDILGLKYLNFTHLIKTLNVADKFSITAATSKYEDELIKYLSQFTTSIEPHNRTILNKQEIDIYLPDQRIGIEFNGDYWHSREFKTKLYHHNKAREAMAKGIRLIQIYEFEWLNPIMQNKLKQMLSAILTNNSIPAEECWVRLVNKQAAEDFIAANTLRPKQAAKYVGLFYNGQLAQLTGFTDKTMKFNCTKLDLLVTNGLKMAIEFYIEQFNLATLNLTFDLDKDDANLPAGLNSHIEPHMATYTLNVDSHRLMSNKPQNSPECELSTLLKITPAGTITYQIIV